jgi:hypothetical protein
MSSRNACRTTYRNGNSDDPNRRDLEQSDLHTSSSSSSSSSSDGRKEELVRNKRVQLPNNNIRKYTTTMWLV